MGKMRVDYFSCETLCFHATSVEAGDLADITERLLYHISSMDILSVSFIFF